MAFPGGFMHIDEDTESCARRELQEETALTAAVLEQLGCYSDVNRDPRERVVTIAYYGIIKNQTSLAVMMQKMQDGLHLMKYQH